MQKSKIIGRKDPKAPVEKEKIIDIDPENKVDDLELIPGETVEEDTEEEDALLDDDEVDPFKDKWEE